MPNAFPFLLQSSRHRVIPSVLLRNGRSKLRKRFENCASIFDTFNLRQTARTEERRLQEANKHWSMAHGRVAQKMGSKVFQHYKSSGKHHKELNSLIKHSLPMEITAGIGLGIVTSVTFWKLHTVNTQRKTVEFYNGYDKGEISVEGQG